MPLTPRGHLIRSTHPLQAASSTLHRWVAGAILPDFKRVVIWMCGWRAGRGGAGRQVVLVALEGVDLEAVQREVDAQCDALPRGDTARQALSHSCVVRVESQARPCCCPEGCSPGPPCHLAQTD